MNMNLNKSLYPLKGIARFESLKRILSSFALMGIAFLLLGCAAFSGRETVGEYVDDAAITASVKSAIFQDPKLKASQIHVETFKNQVQLSGFVDSPKDITRAGQIAANVEGVQGVNNSLIVRKRTLRHR